MMRSFIFEIFKYYQRDKIKRIGWGGHIGRMGAHTSSYKVLLENLKERDHQEDLGVDGRLLQ
jgi:hypothetical protein